MCSQLQLLWEKHLVPVPAVLWLSPGLAPRRGRSPWQDLGRSSPRRRWLDKASFPEESPPGHPACLGPSVRAQWDGPSTVPGASCPPPPYPSTP